MRYISYLAVILIILTSCATPSLREAEHNQPAVVLVSTDTPQANLPNPASAYCEQQGYTLEIRTAADGSQSGVCKFPDGSECDEWAYFRGECAHASQSEPAYTATVEAPFLTPVPTEIQTPIPVDPAGYQGWWTYNHSVYNFSIMLPEDWIVEEVTSFDPIMNGHTLSLHPTYDAKENIRMTFKHAGEEARLWPTGVGQGEFIPQGTLDIAGEPALRLLLVCPTGEITSIWYHQAEGEPNITRGELEFGFIYSAGTHCEPGSSLSGKIQWVGEMIIASLQVP